jgi:hypothetical protein
MQRWLRRALIILAVSSLSACIVVPRPYGGYGHGHDHDHGRHGHRDFR